MTSGVPDVRIRVARPGPVREGGDFVLYRMSATRRRRYNFALQRAVEWARRLGKPLLVLETLPCNYPWASERTHAFLLAGMRDNAEALSAGPALYYPFVEERPGRCGRLFAELAVRACVGVVDDYPTEYGRRLASEAAEGARSLLEAVDSNGLLPFAAADRAFATAHATRRHLQKTLRPHLLQTPKPDPLRGVDLRKGSIPRSIRQRWPRASAALLRREAKALARLPINHAVAAAATPGGSSAAGARLRRFVKEKLARYVDDRNHPDIDGTSGLSPYLAHGHISPHEVFAAVAGAEGWHIGDLAEKATGSRTGWWGMGAAAEAFLDQLVTWREVGTNACAHMPDYDRYESLPEWARRTLGEHETDEREYTYTLRHFERAETHDALWNAAQRQLRTEGRIHNYMRMLWGKKILQWTESPGEALEVMIGLNNKYALDAEDPNSYSGIFWVLGRYDRAWGPERPIFGKVRYMSSENTARKLRVRGYIARYGA